MLVAWRLPQVHVVPSFRVPASFALCMYLLASSYETGLPLLANQGATRTRPRLLTRPRFFVFTVFIAQFLGGDRRAQYTCRCEKLLLLLASASRA